MTELTQTLPTAATQGNIVSRMFNAYLRWAVALAEGNARVRAVRTLSEMSDEALAERGLRREDIVRHVFSDSYFV